MIFSIAPRFKDRAVKFRCGDAINQGWGNGRYAGHKRHSIWRDYNHAYEPEESNHKESSGLYGNSFPVRADQMFVELTYGLYIIANSKDSMTKPNTN